MRKTLAGCLVVLALGAFATSASAQTHGATRMAWGLNGVGVELSADFARGMNDDAFKTNYFGGYASVNLPMVSIFAGAGSVKGTGDFESDAEITFGGGLAVRVFDPPASPVSIGLQGGLGYLSEDGDKLLSVPLGVVLAIDVPSPSVGVVPWIMPRVEIQRYSPEGFDSETETGFGFSGGLTITSSSGFGGHVSLDWLSIGDPSFKPLIVGVGLHYVIKVPSFPGM